MQSNQGMDTPDFLALHVLTSELSSQNEERTEQTIKELLEREGLPVPNHERIELLRRFRKKVEKALLKEGSKYYTGKDSGFSTTVLLNDFSNDFPSISREVISRFLSHAIVMYVYK